MFGTMKMSAFPATGDDPLRLGGLLAHRVIERERAVDDAVLYLAAAVHLRERGGVKGRGHVGFTTSTAARTATLGSATPNERASPTVFW